jgi:hypothetical protein
MGPVTLLVSAFLVVACGLKHPSLAIAQQHSDSLRVSRTNPWHAAAGVLALNVLPWAYNWYVERWSWANIGTRTWKDNFRLGFGWDDNSFRDNQLAHPYHGSLYFHSARASGYGFWGSLPFVAAGSAGWEYLFENERPSLNDLVNTTLGGMALGEATFRLSSLLGLGARRVPFARQASAFALSPIGRTQALIHGRYPDLQSSPELRKDDDGWLALGSQSGHPYLTLSYQYGSAFTDQPIRPYDVFEFAMQLGPQPDATVREIGISGLLARRDLRRSTRDHLVLGLYQHYDYLDVPGLKMSEQGLSGALLYQRRLGPRTQLGLNTHLEAVLLGAVSSEYGHAWLRDYDYGSGGGGRLTTVLRRDGRDLVRFDTRLVWLHSWYGADADHLAISWRLGTAVRLGHLIGVGGDIGTTNRSSWYAGLPTVSHRIMETRAYLIWPTE